MTATNDGEIARATAIVNEAKVGGLIDYGELARLVASKFTFNSMDTSTMLRHVLQLVALDASSSAREVGWVTADLLRMAKDLEKQAKDLADWHDPDGRRRANLHRAVAELHLAYASLSALPSSCGKQTFAPPDELGAGRGKIVPSGPCRLVRGHAPGCMGDAPNPTPGVGGLDTETLLEHYRPKWQEEVREELVRRVAAAGGSLDVGATKLRVTSPGVIVRS